MKKQTLELTDKERSSLIDELWAIRESLFWKEHDQGKGNTKEKQIIDKAINQLQDL